MFEGTHLFLNQKIANVDSSSNGVWIHENGMGDESGSLFNVFWVEVEILKKGKNSLERIFFISEYNK